MIRKLLTTYSMSVIALILLLIGLVRLAFINRRPVPEPVQIVTVENEEMFATGFILDDGIIGTAAHVAVEPSLYTRGVITGPTTQPTTQPVIAMEVNVEGDTAIVASPKVRGHAKLRRPLTNESVHITSLVPTDHAVGCIPITVHGHILGGPINRRGMTVWLCDCPAQPGMSGGPVIADSDGAVVGVVSGADLSVNILEIGVFDER